MASADYTPLLASDQLRNAQAWGAAFVGYEEAPITFAPTYKYDPGTDVYDTSEKRRPPAYCDRVLWRGPKKHAACTTYGRHELRAADHRPVSAALALSVAVPNEERRQEVHREIVRTLDAWENASIPTAALDTNDLQFGSVSFGEAVSRTLVLTNTGQTRLAFSFQPLPDAAGSLDKPPWLFVSPWSDMLLPGRRAKSTRPSTSAHTAPPLSTAALRRSRRSCSCGSSTGATSIAPSRESGSARAWASR